VIGPTMCWRQKAGTGTRRLWMGNMDTVWPPDSPFQNFRREGDTMYGPGVSDMKGGLVIMLYALKALAAAGELDSKAISVFLNSDEEMGSLSSRKYVEQQEVLHDYGLGYESSGNNNLTRQRKGPGQARSRRTRCRLPRRWGPGTRTPPDQRA